MRTAQILLEALLEVKADVEAGKYPDTGICVAVGSRVGDNHEMEFIGDARDQVTDVLRVIMVTWPEYSGDRLYPVRGDYYSGPGDERGDYMWGYGDYAAARRRLLDYCINVTERLV